MDLGQMLADALARHGFGPPAGSGVAAAELQQAALDFLRAVRAAEQTGMAEPDQPNDPLHPPGGSSEAPATL